MEGAGATAADAAGILRAAAAGGGVGRGDGRGSGGWSADPHTPQSPPSPARPLSPHGQEPRPPRGQRRGWDGRRRRRARPAPAPTNQLAIPATTQPPTPTPPSPRQLLPAAPTRGVCNGPRCAIEGLDLDAFRDRLGRKTLLERPVLKYRLGRDMERIQCKTRSVSLFATNPKHFVLVGVNDVSAEQHRVRQNADMMHCMATSHLLAVMRSRSILCQREDRRGESSAPCEVRKNERNDEMLSCGSGLA